MSRLSLARPEECRDRPDPPPATPGPGEATGSPGGPTRATPSTGSGSRPRGSIAPTRSVRSSRRALLVRFGVSLAFLALLASWLDLDDLAGRLASLEPTWVALALGLSVLQVVASAWRWRFTAGRLGLRLPFGEALREYYLATFLNQVLPGGVLGDVSRAWRHARSATEEARRSRDPSGSIVRAVVLERASGQLVMAGVATLSVLLLPLPLGPGGRALLLGGLLLAGVLLAMLLARSRRALPSHRSLAGRIWHDAWAGLLAPRALPVQLLTSLLVVGTYLATWVAAARAVGVETPMPILLPLVAPVLMAMLVPMTVAGWGAREGAAAALWAAVGLPGAEGVAVSVAYGLLVLFASVPGAVVLLVLLLRSRTEVQLEEDVGTQREGPAGRA